MEVIITPEERAKKLADFEIECEEKSKKILADSYMGFELPDGKMIAAFVKNPNYLASIAAMDLAFAGKQFAAGNLLWDSCYMREHSNPECEQDFYKKAIVLHISSLLEIAAPLFKKK